MNIHWLRIIALGLTIVAKFVFVPFVQLLREAGGSVADGLGNVIIFFGITEPLPDDRLRGEERKFRMLKLITFRTQVERNVLT
jgi:hypothetical protein